MRVKRKGKDPRVGTGKKPKGSGRRLYTDENPKDTVGIKFATIKDAKATVAKVKRLKFEHVCGCGESFTPVKDILADGKQNLGWK